jgi:hypothetical protein
MSPRDVGRLRLLGPGNDARNLALALDAFLAGHRQCWRLYGEGLEAGEYGTVVWMACVGCGTTVVLTTESHT